MQSLITSQTGFLTELALDDGKNYMTAAFRFIKQTTHMESNALLTKNEKLAGKYLTVKVKETLCGGAPFDC
ncbi:hypothetical protein D1872_186120 [compost metagenome]